MLKTKHNTWRVRRITVDEAVVVSGLDERVSS